MTLLRAAIAWHVFALTGSAFHLGLIGLAQFVPHVAFTLVGGAVADAHDRRRVIMLSQCASAACGVALWLATRSDAVSLPFLYGLVMLAATAGAFESPSRQAMVPTLVPREQFPRAVTVTATVTALAFMTGPAAGGLVIAELGIASAYLAQALLLVASLVGLFFLPPRPPEGPPRGIGLETIREGLRFVWHQPVVLGCMTLDLFAVVFGGATALLPIYADEILQVGARGYGILSSSFEAGALLMSIFLVWMRPVRRAGRALLWAVAAFGLATVAFGLSTWFPLSLAAYVAVGMADQVSVVLRGTAIQLSTPDALRGRVSAVNMLFIGASNQLGAVESGFVAAVTSAPFAVVSGGLGCLLVVALVAWRNGPLRGYRTDAPAGA